MKRDRARKVRRARAECTRTTYTAPGLETLREILHQSAELVQHLREDPQGRAALAALGFEDEAQRDEARALIAEIAGHTNSRMEDDRP